MYSLYIGLTQNAIGGNKPVDVVALKATFPDWFTAYTVVDATGCYNGASEPMLNLLVSDVSLALVKAFCDSVNREFHQDCVGCVVLPDMMFL